MKIKISLVLILSIFVSSLSADNFFERLFKVEKEEVRTEGFRQLDLVIKSLSEQLIANKNVPENKKIILTSIVKLDSLNKTSNFGRTISESLINDLHSNKFQVVDLRANKDLSINADGEYFLSRDIQKISEKHGDVNILVGTYSKFEYDNVVINIRLLNSITAEVLSTAKVVYYFDDCQLVDLCSSNDSMGIVNK